MSDYPSNSNKQKQSQDITIPEKKLNKVTSGKVKKKSEIRKFTDVFIQEDMNSVWDHILFDIIIPTAKSAFSDVVKNGIDMILYGSDGRPNDKKSTASRISYRDYYSSNNKNRPNVPSNRPSYNYDDVIIDSRGKAEEVLAKMDELIDVYKIASVADFYELVDVSCNYTDYKYGWTDIRDARIIRTRDGYIIKLPKAMPLD